jgi:NAD(P)-dependent dehydrogenase (short-subunit alcohol dehydrogenase family)
LNSNDKKSLLKTEVGFFCTSHLSACIQQIAYQYAKKGARLALVARREASLHDVAAKAKDIGSPDVLVVAGDVANPEDCQRFVQATVEHFGQCEL